MAAGIAMRRCGNCDKVVFPPRPLCPRCGADDWHRALAMTGEVEELTWRRPRRKRKQTPLGHWIERDNIQLASVRTDLGPVITVLAPDGNVEPGMKVDLEAAASVSVARESAELRAHPAGDGHVSKDPASPKEPLPGEWMVDEDVELTDADERVPGEWESSEGAKPPDAASLREPGLDVHRPTEPDLKGRRPG